MKRISPSDILQSARRNNLSTEAKAAQLLFDTEKILSEALQREPPFAWNIHSWKQGHILCHVAHPVGAQIIYHNIEHVLTLLRKKYPKYHIKGISVRVVEAITDNTST